jgi:methylmalonyl-CoA/ethylmalonyl-CoA epimerase
MEPSLHHVGHVVNVPLESIVEQWRESVGATTVSAIVHDPIQKVRAIFLQLPGSGVQIELVEATGADSPVAAFADRGGGMHHLCFEVEDLEAHMAAMRARKAVVVRRAQPAVAFGGRRIGWMLTRERLLVEYLERRSTAT